MTKDELVLAARAGDPGVTTTRLDEIHPGYAITMELHAAELGSAPSSVIAAGSNFVLHMHVGFLGGLLDFVKGHVFLVMYGTENLETGSRKTLVGGSFMVPPTSDSGSVLHTAPPFTAGVTGSGSDLEIPAGFDSGTFSIQGSVRMDNVSEEPIMAFDESLVIMVV